MACAIGQKTFSSLSINASLNGANGSCAVPGLSSPNSFTVNVSGVGTLSSTNRLLMVSVALTNCGTGTVNLNEVQFRVVSPSGTCLGVYSGGLSTIASGIHYVNLVSNTSCLNSPNTANDKISGAPYMDDGNNGHFNAQFNGVASNYSVFDGLNADGTWRVIFSETTTSPPCLQSIRLTFGNPTVINQGTKGDNCSNPIEWNGINPICASTFGMVGSSQMPGALSSSGTSFVNIGGIPCQWNGENNNDVWIKFTAIDNYTCMSFSGISGTGVSLQSVVVTDANQDNDNNPCTQIPKTTTNDPNWQLVSCPRNAVYTTTSGTQLNQQHCFVSEIGRSYYLVVDGEAGSNSKFWVWGASYKSSVLNLKENTVTQNFINSSVRYPKVNLTSDDYLVVNLKNASRSYNTQKVEIYNAAGALIYTNTTSLNNNLVMRFFLGQFLQSGLNVVRVELTCRLGITNNFIFKQNKYK